MTYAENGMPAKNPLSAQIDLSKFSTDDFVPASAEEKAQQEVMGESVSFFKDGMRRLMRNKLAMTSIIVLLVMVVAIIILPMIIPYGYDEIIRVDGSRDRHITNLAPLPVFRAGTGIYGGNRRKAVPPCDGHRQPGP